MEKNGKIAEKSIKKPKTTKKIKKMNFLLDIFKSLC